MRYTTVPREFKPFIWFTKRIIFSFLILSSFLIFTPVSAFDIYVPKEVNFEPSDKSGSNYAMEIKVWSNKNYLVHLAYMDLFGLPEPGIPEDTITLTIALQFFYPEQLEDISENWGKARELRLDLGEDWEAINYNTFDAKKIKLGNKTKCMSFYTNNDFEEDIIFGIYCRADSFSNNEVEAALRSIKTDDTPSTKPPMK